MAPVKSIVKPSRKANASKSGDITRQGGSSRPDTLERTVLAALKAAQRYRRTHPATVRPSPKRTHAVIASNTSGHLALIHLDPRTLAKLERDDQGEIAKLRQQGLLAERTIRIRPQGGPDRRFLIEYAIDPHDDAAVLFRIRPVSNLELEPPLPRMLTTQEAADRLNVSRPYIAKLVDQGTFEGVVRTHAGHRRIPETEVDRVHDEMRISRQTSLQQLEALNADLRAKEHHAARTTPKRRWASKKP
jgi:excisionase family DNA binding protein